MPPAPREPVEFGEAVTIDGRPSHRRPDRLLRSTSEGQAVAVDDEAAALTIHAGSKPDTTSSPVPARTGTGSPG